jgi:hypothetical protein
MLSHWMLIEMLEKKNAGRNAERNAWRKACYDTTAQCLREGAVKKMHAPASYDTTAQCLREGTVLEDARFG